jgi:hypothetical protein
VGQKRKRCATVGCKKMATDLENSIFCKECQQQQEKNDDPFTGFKRLSEVDAEKWGRMDAEIRNALQGQRIKNLEIELAEFKEKQRREEYTRSQLSKQAEIKVLQNQVESLKKNYEEFTTQLAEKYDVNKEKMTIDPDTGLIRELDF